MTQRDRDISTNPNSGETAHGVVSALLGSRLTRRFFGKLVVGGVAAEIARQAVVNSQQVEAAPVCDFPKVQGDVVAKFNVEMVYHNTEDGHNAGDRLPDGSKAYIFYKPEIIPLDEALKSGKEVAGVIFGTNMAVLKKDPQQMVEYIQGPNSKEISWEIQGPSNKQVYSKDCDTYRDGLALDWYNKIGKIQVDGRVFDELTNDPQTIEVSHKEFVRYSMAKLKIQRPPQRPTPTPTPAPTPEVKPTPVPPAVPQPPQLPKELPPTGSGDQFESGYCYAVNEMLGNPPSPVCPPDFPIPGSR